MPTLSFADADRPLIAAAFDALHGSLTGTLRLAEEAAAEDAKCAELPGRVRGELNRVDALRTQIKN